MRKVTMLVLLVVALLLATIPLTAVAAPPTTVTVSWVEDAVRYNPDGSVAGSWTNDPNGPMDLRQTGRAFHSVDIGQFYNTVLPDVEGSLTISGNGRLSGHTTYTSLRSGLPIKERLSGTVTVNPVAGTMVGNYTQYGYAFGPQEEVLAWYPGALPEKSPQAGGWWFIAYTVYTVYQ